MYGVYRQGWGRMILYVWYICWFGHLPASCCASLQAEDGRSTLARVGRRRADVDPTVFNLTFTLSSTGEGAKNTSTPGLRCSHWTFVCSQVCFGFIVAVFFLIFCYKDRIFYSKIIQSQKGAPKLFFQLQVLSRLGSCSATGFLDLGKCIGLYKKIRKHFK